LTVFDGFKLSVFLNGV